MILLPLALVLMAAPNPALLYEQKCLYCHSDELLEHPDFTAEQWATTVQRMRSKARVLVTRADARVLTQFILSSLRLHLSAPASVKTARAPVPEHSAASLLEPGQTPAAPLVTSPKPTEEAPSEEPLETVDAQGAQLVAERCSKCHTLNRVFGKLDSLERSLSTVARMRIKTGSGITHEDAQRIERFLRAQFSSDESHAN